MAPSFEIIWRKVFDMRELGEVPEEARDGSGADSGVGSGTLVFGRLEDQR
jgi:hypothetical protein